MAEDTWLKCSREYFVGMNAVKLGVTAKVANKLIKAYNEDLQRNIFGESLFVAEDLKLTVLKAGGLKVVRTESQD